MVHSYIKRFFTIIKRNKLIVGVIISTTLVILIPFLVDFENTSNNLTTNISKYITPTAKNENNTYSSQNSSNSKSFEIKFSGDYLNSLKEDTGKSTIKGILKKCFSITTDRQAIMFNCLNSTQNVLRLSYYPSSAKKYEIAQVSSSGKYLTLLIGNIDSSIKGKYTIPERSSEDINYTQEYKEQPEQPNTDNDDDETNNGFTSITILVVDLTEQKVLINQDLADTILEFEISDSDIKNKSYLYKIYDITLTDIISSKFKFIVSYGGTPLYNSKVLPEDSNDYCPKLPSDYFDNSTFFKIVTLDENSTNYESMNLPFIKRDFIQWVFPRFNKNTLYIISSDRNYNYSLLEYSISNKPILRRKVSMPKIPYGGDVLVSNDIDKVIFNVDNITATGCTCNDLQCELLIKRFKMHNKEQNQGIWVYNINKNSLKRVAYYKVTEEQINYRFEWVNEKEIDINSEIFNYVKIE